MLIVLLRHGQTAYNEQRRYQGAADVPLSPAGRAALKKADFETETVYVTPLCRTAQTAGLAALGQTKYVAQVRTLIETERPYLLEGLRALGLRVIEGRVNYLLFRADETLGERLEKLGVVVRSCGNYPGLDDSWYRTAVRTRRENDALLAALREAMA